MATLPHSVKPQGQVQGKIIEAEVSITSDAIHPLPLACALYAVEESEGVWLCAYFGSNRSNFAFLPQKDHEIDEARLGITFQTKMFISRNQYQPSSWEEFKKARLRSYASH